jgi:hypothetical protein
MKTNCLQEVGVALRRGARLTSAFLLFAWSGLALAASSFPDVASTSWASLYIEAIYGAGITTGCGSGNYCPANPVTRDQMAAFIIRAKEGEPATACSVAPFTDVQAGNAFCKYIKRLVALSITTGCGGGNYCPSQAVDRQQMAAFIVRALEGEPASTYCSSGSPFADVPASNTMCKYIKRLAELQVTTGCGGGNYCPSQTVTRDQMAAFLARAFLGMGAVNARALNDTGIQYCGTYPTGNGTCDGTQPAGQDAHYGRDAQAAAGTLSKVGGGEAGFDFTALDANGNPTSPSSGANPHPCVRDNVTGLIWEVKTGDYGLRDKNWTYTWYDTNSPDGNRGYASGGTCYQPGLCDTEKYVVEVNAVGLCGYNDWRMPTVKELEGIAHLGRFNPAIDPTYFPNTPSSPFWSASPCASNSLYALTVGFSSGDANFTGRNVSNGGATVRLVRGGRQF